MLKAMTAPHVSETNRPRHRKVVVRTALIGAWLVFWLNAILYPCMAAGVAPSRSDCGADLGLVTAASVEYQSVQLHADNTSQALDPPCCHVLSSVPGNTATGLGLATDHQYGHWATGPLTWSATLLAPTRLGSLAYLEIPPPRVPLYLRTSRLRN